jgi:hypothetical protein
MQCIHAQRESGTRVHSHRNIVLGYIWASHALHHKRQLSTHAPAGLLQYYVVSLKAHIVKPRMAGLLSRTGLKTQIS